MGRSAWQIPALGSPGGRFGSVCRPVLSGVLGMEAWRAVVAGEAVLSVAAATVVELSRAATAVAVVELGKEARGRGR